MVTIKYRDGHNKIVSLRADRCSGVIPAYSDTYYWEFYLNGKHVARVAESRLQPGFKAKASRLYAKPWRDRLAAYTDIRLHERNYHDFDGLPKDAERIWDVNGDRDTWVIECEGRAILHIMNNPEVSKRGEFKTALKKLFPNKPIKVYYPTVSVVEV